MQDLHMKDLPLKHRGRGWYFVRIAPISGSTKSRGLREREQAAHPHRHGEPDGDSGRPVRPALYISQRSRHEILAGLNPTRWQAVMRRKYVLLN